MVNSKPFPSAITAFWNKALFILLFLTAQVLAAQKPRADRQSGFDEAFFSAQAFKLKGNGDKAMELFAQLLEQRPKLAVLHYELARLYAESGDPQNTLYHAEQAVKWDDQNRWYLRLLASVYDQMAMSEASLPLYQRLVQIEPRAQAYRLKLVDAYAAQEQYQLALQQLDSLKSMGMPISLLAERKKDLFLEMGDVDGAAEAIRELIDSDPDNLEYWGSLGQLFEANDRGEEALPAYRKMLSLDPSDPRPHLDLANYYRNTGRLDSSLYHLKIAMRSPLLETDKKIPVLVSLFELSAGDSLLRAEAYEMLDTLREQNGDDARVFALYGDYLSRDGRDREAIEYYRKALSHEGGQKFALWEQLLLIEAQNNWYQELELDAVKAVETFPNQPLPYLFAGMALLQNGQPKEAQSYLDDGLDLVFGSLPLKMQFYLQLAELHHRNGDEEKSDSYFEKVIQIRPDHALALNNYAYYLALRGDKLDQALRMTEKSNQLVPDSPTYLDTWAWVLFKKGNYETAREKIEKALTQMPQGNAELWEHYGDILWALSETEAAREAYRKALEAGGSADQLEGKLKRLP